MMTQGTPETSVLVSLAEIAEIEEERIREEQRQHALARAERAREERLAAERARAEEAARAAAGEQARAEQQRAEAEEQARREARRQAAVEVARIDAAAKARLAAEEAARAHELALIAAREAAGSRRLPWVLGGLLVAVVCAAAVLGWHLDAQVTALEQDASRLAERHRQLQDEHRRAMKATLAALGERQAELAGRAGTAPPEAVQAAAQEARASTGSGVPDAAKLAAYRARIEHWERSLARRATLELLDARRVDLTAWAEAARRSSLLDEALAAAERARQGGDAAIGAYRASLDDLAAALAARGGSRRPRPRDRAPTTAPGGSCDPHDPICGLDGKPL